MFGKKVQVSLDLSEDLVQEIDDLLKKNNLNLSQAVDLFLYSSIENEDLSFDENLALDFSKNLNLRAKDFLIGKINEGRRSFKEPKITQEEVLLFLGVY